MAAVHVPAMTIERIGYGAGQRDLPDRANLLRLLVGLLSPSAGSVGVLGCSIPAEAEELRPRVGELQGLGVRFDADRHAHGAALVRVRAAHAMGLVDAGCVPDGVVDGAAADHLDTQPLDPGLYGGGKPMKPVDEEQLP